MEWLVNEPTPTSAINHSLTLVDKRVYFSGQEVGGYILDKLLTVTGRSAEEKYWSSFPLLTYDETNDVESSKEVTRAKMSASQRGECFPGSSICLDEYLFKGGQGDVWRAHAIKNGSRNFPDEETEYLILKRMRSKDNPSILRCALREIYFGNLLQHRESFPRLLTYFVHEGDHWLVFKDEGSSLQSYLYNTGTNGAQIFSPSRAWRKLRTTDLGAASLKSIMFQLISNAAELHSMSIIHRDIKPSNVLLQATKKPRLLTSDFSSAVDDAALASRTVNSLYGVDGPTIGEESLDYAPPEVRLSISNDDLSDVNALPFDLRRPESYDIWSVGMVFLEILLGTPDVFHVDQRTEAMIVQLLQKKNIDSPVIRKKALYLAGLADFGIYRDQSFNHEADNGAVSRRSSRRLSMAAQFSRLLVGDMGKYLSQPLPLSVISLAPPHVPLTKEHGQPEPSNESQAKNPGACSLSANELSKMLVTLRDAITHRDILGIGFHDKWGLDLLVRLLCFNPMERISMKDALSHAYFHGPYVSVYDGLEFATFQELNAHVQKWKKLHRDAVVINADTNDGLESTRDEALVSLEEVLEYEDADAAGVSPLLSYADQVEINFQRLSDDNSEENDSMDDSESILDEAESPSTTGRLPSSAFQVQETISNLRFVCPKCGRKFDEWSSCMQHVRVRRHGQYCGYQLVGHEMTPSVPPLTYNEQLLSSIFPACLSDRSFEIHDERSGWCDLQGKRRYMEDFHTVYRHEGVGDIREWTLFGVFDGHLGSFAARYASQRVHQYYQEYVEQLIRYPEIRESVDVQLLNATIGQKSLSYAFQAVDRDLSTAYSTFGGELPIGGTTASVLVVERTSTRKLRLTYGHVGDSRLVLCRWSHEQLEAVAVQVTEDHTAKNAKEIASLMQRGGFVTEVDGALRVQGELIVTRALGDTALGLIISPVPDTGEIIVGQASMNDEISKSATDSASCSRYFHRLQSWSTSCRQEDSEKSAPCPQPNDVAFAILASDGLWDVMSIEEAIHMVCSFLLESESMETYWNSQLDIDTSAPDDLVFFDDGEAEVAGIFQRASRLLAYEALLRGSLDNIGVSIIDLAFT